HTRFSRDWSSDVCSSDLQRCEATDADSRAQAETMQQLDYLADQVLQQLSRTTAQMQELNQHTAVSSSQIEDCVSQMQEAENSMQAIQQSNPRIEESMP